MLSWVCVGLCAKKKNNCCFQVYDTDSRINNIQSSLDTALARDNFNGSHDLMAVAVAPTCEEFILECK